MTTNIYLARLIAQERENDMLRYVESRRRQLAARPARPSWKERLLQHLPFKHSESVTADTCIAA
ncbi:MAG TPA: hypothetical protein VLI04_19365 [Nocardioidaceae bacterium]|nr:hypothetical protein [Nocardioidaceae bacterium]